MYNEQKKEDNYIFMTKKFLQTLLLATVCTAVSQWPSAQHLHADAASVMEGTPGVEVDNMLFPFNTMNKDDALATGVHKLTPQEQSNFIQWVRNRDMSLQPPTKTTVSVIDNSGKNIELANGQKFTLGSSAKKKAVKWEVGCQVELYPTTKPNNYMLKNMKTNEMIKAKIDSSTTS